MSFYSEEMSFSGGKSATECVEILSETLETQKLVEDVVKASPMLVPPPLQVEAETGETTIKIGGALLKRPNEYKPNTVECKLPSKIENAVPQKWESSLTQAVRTTAPDPDTFSRIPSRHSASPMACALSIAPAQPFNPVPHATTEPVPLPEESEPYFPPEHPPQQEEEKVVVTKIEEKPPIPKPKSLFVKALEIAPDRPFSPAGGGAPPPPRSGKKKPKDPLDKLLEELPKPGDKSDMRSALTTAPERPYTPLHAEYSSVSSSEETRQTVDRSQLAKHLKPEELPPSFTTMRKAAPPKPPSYYSPVVIEERIKAQSEETTTHSSETTVVEQETAVRQPTDSSTPSYAPVFQGFTCSFKNKSEHSQFSVEVSTTPPVPTPPPKPQTPISYVATVEQKPATVTKETAVKRQEQIRRQVEHEIQRQAEEVVVRVKPLARTAMLRKAEALPSYQVDLQATAEADLLLMERRKRAEQRIELQKREREQQQQVEERIEQQRTERQQQQVVVQQQQAPVPPPQKQQQQDDDRIEEQRRAVEQQAVVQQRAPVPPPPQKQQVEDRIEQQNKERQQRAAVQQQQQQVEERIEQQREEGKQQAAVQHQQAPPVPPAEAEEPHLVTKPVIKIEAGDTNGVAERINFQPVGGGGGGGGMTASFPPRPRSLTPSMINKAPALLPYYQDNLVAHFHAPLGTNVLDPTSPAISRTPSPHPETRSRSPSPFPSGGRQERAKSPAQGPPPNPLQSSAPLPTPQDSRMQLARQREQKEVHRPHHQNGREQVSQNVAYCGNVQQQVQRCSVRDSQQCQIQVSGASRTEATVKSHEEQLLGQRQSYTVVQQSTDGLTQVQRRHVVSEEYERSHKETDIVTASATSGKQHPFARVNVAAAEPPNNNIHVTDPRHVEVPKSFQSQPQHPLPTRHVFAPGSLAPIKHVASPSVCQRPSQNVPVPDLGAGTGRQAGGVNVAPKRGRGLVNAAALPGARVPLCGHCHGQIRGPFITALGKIWCPQHFVCATPSCRRPLQDIGFVEEKGQLYCEYCFEQYLAPPCSKCSSKIKGDCLRAIGKNFHPECFNCAYCGKLFGSSAFFLEDGNPYCEADWNELFTTKCYACGFPVEAGDRWVEALNNNYHSQCFNCTMCKKNLEGQSFFAKGGRPFCKNHAR